MIEGEPRRRGSERESGLQGLRRLRPREPGAVSSQECVDLLVSRWIRRVHIGAAERRAAGACALRGVLGAGLSSADRSQYCQYCRQYCNGSAPDSPTRSLTRSVNDGPRARARIRNTATAPRDATEPHADSSTCTEAAPRRPGIWSASRGNAARRYRQHCTGRAEDLGRLGACCPRGQPRATRRGNVSAVNDASQAITPARAPRPPPT